MKGIILIGPRSLLSGLRWLLMGLVLMSGGSSAFAVSPDEILSDPVLEARARALSAGLRCLVCQNQSIDDSDAPLARDLRLLVRERLTAGDSDEDVEAFIVARYGEYVLLRPPFSVRTVILWLVPLVLLIAAGIVAGRGAVAMRQAREGGVVEELTPEEEARLRELLKPKDGDGQV
jgi:cytochrome c-type biogenesis protein CcmH